MKSAEIIEEEFEGDSVIDSDINLLKPKLKISWISMFVGQDEAKKVLAVSVYNHYKRVLADKDLDVELQKSNILD